MARASARQQAAARRDRRAKVMLGVLGVVLLAVLGFEVPHYLKHRSGGSVPVGAGTTAVSTTGASGVPAAPGVTPGEPQLAPEPQSDQLVRFSAFPAKDPFRAQASAGDSSTVAPSSPVRPRTTVHTSTSTSVTPAKPTVHKSGTPRQPTTLVPAAVLTLDGKAGVVVVGAGFPAKKPVFRLAAVGQNVIWVSLVHGVFAGGKPLLQLRLGRPAKLVDATGKKTYVLELVRVTTKRIRVTTKATTATSATTTTTVTTTQTTTTPSPSTTNATP